MINQSLLEIAYLRQQEMLQQAEAERLYRQLKGDRPGLLKQVGPRLAGAAWQLKAYFQSNPATPILGQK
jgi:hypothetical protein